jgi:hypothetical protein
MTDKIMHHLNKVASSLSNKQVKVGFIDNATYPDGTPVAVVANGSEYGDPDFNRPPRPFFRNAISEHKSEWRESIEKGARKGVPFDDLLNLIGRKISGDVVESIATLLQPPLSPRTLEDRESRGNKSTKPLVDTKVLIRGVTYEVGEIEPTSNSQ